MPPGQPPVTTAVSQAGFARPGDPYAQQPGTPHPSVSHPGGPHPGAPNSGPVGSSAQFQNMMMQRVSSQQGMRSPHPSGQSPPVFAKPTGPAPTLSRSNSHDPYLQTPPGTPRPPPTSDPYSQQPGTPHPDAMSRIHHDPFSRPPGPTGVDDPYAHPPGTPQPDQFNPRSAAMSQPSTSYPGPSPRMGDPYGGPKPRGFMGPVSAADPYAHQPGTPHPSIAGQDPYGQPPGTPRAMPSDPYAHQPGTPMPGHGGPSDTNSIHQDLHQMLQNRMKAGDPLAAQRHEPPGMVSTLCFVHKQCLVLQSEPPLQQ